MLRQIRRFWLMNAARISFILLVVVFVLVTKDVWRMYFHSNDAVVTPAVPFVTKNWVAEVTQSTEPSHAVVSANDLHTYLPLQFESVSQFESTIKSCLGRYCMDEVFSDGDGEVRRYGLLAPVITPEIHYIRQVLNRLKAKGYELELTRHVPPYGYGRNHGWSRIVRFVDSVPRSAFHQLLLVTNSTSISNKKAFIAQVQVRALTRWHCRLNHVAAHTSMLTVPIDVLKRNPISTIQNILSFINAKDMPSLLQAIDINAFHQKRLLPSLPTELAVLADETLANELRISKNLTRWPCRNFKELSADLLVQPYYELAAGCTSSKYVKCSVQYDFSEQAQQKGRL